MSTRGLASVDIVMSPATLADLPRMQEIRRAAFEPIFSAFRATLGERIYERAQAREDAAQGELLASLLEVDSPWEVYTADRPGTMAGFISILCNGETRVGEIGLNAVHPDHAGQGIGTAMYDFAVERMKAAGMEVATVSTGGDASHAPARRAYEKAGFNRAIPGVWLCREL